MSRSRSQSRSRSRTVGLPGPDFPDEQSERYDQISQGLLQFALELCRQLRLAGRTGNILFSPYAVASTLEVLLHAARGATAHQIACALHLQPARRSHWPITDDYFARLHAQCRSCVSVSSLRLKLGNLIYHDRSLRIRREFRRRDAAGAVRLRAHDLAADPDGSLTRIADEARQAVPRFGAHEILPELSSSSAVAQAGLVSSTSLLLLSFVGFAGGWRVRFSRARTTDAEFHLAPGRTKKVRMMHQSGRFLLADCPALGASALVLPYRHSGAVMVLFLPQDLDGLGALQEQLSAGTFELQFRECDVDVSLPRFRLRQVTDLKRVLPALGVDDVFTERADLSGLSSAKGVRVTLARHAACFSASERGGKPQQPDATPATAEASAPSATSTASDAGPAPARLAPDADNAAGPGAKHSERRKFVVDHPFMFLILNNGVDFFLLFGLVKK
ncbi:leukocyte elastase inhibitor-like [Dermacentor andersoni]|uniref:leukocyte elastase inhibitor-like n=1 Tax=Dermacentor andersoni TaxID=34620 RepID=UPI002155DEA2|nr:leukocyte elastase inhibitor-like [Dermacentor andersoni]